MKRISALLLALALFAALLALPASAAPDTAGFAAEVLRLVNLERKNAGLAGLSAGTASLNAAAQKRAEEIAVSFSHTRPDGRSCFTALGDAGVAYLGCGENIAAGQTSPAQVMAGWMNSSGHRANILGNYTQLGVGVYVKNNTLYWAQLFITGKGGSEPTTAATTRTTTTTRTAVTQRAPAATAPPAAGWTAWKSWPPFVQWLLRVFAFGWLWMK